MFGFSLPKILVLAAVVFAVWQGFKYLQRRQEVAERNKADRVREAKRERDGTSAKVEDMVRCKVCESFVPGVGAKSCGRPDCPYPG